MNLAEIGHCGPSPEFLRSKFMNGREDSRHGHVHPDVDRTQLVFDPVCRFVHGFGVGHVGRNRQSANTELSQFVCRAFKSVIIARQQGYIASISGKLRSRRAANAGAGARNHHNLPHWYLLGGSDIRAWSLLSAMQVGATVRSLKAPQSSTTPRGTDPFQAALGFDRPSRKSVSIIAWLGREDSNLRMAESKSAALPLGYAPIRMAPGMARSAAEHNGPPPGDQ